MNFELKKSLDYFYQANYIFIQIFRLNISLMTIYCKIRISL